MARTYFKEWRKHRGYTQEFVVGRLVEMSDPLLPATSASLSRIENGHQPYNQRIVEALAEIYNCDPDHLIRLAPGKGADVVDLWAELSPRRRQQALAVIRALSEDEAGRRASQEGQDGD